MARFHYTFGSTSLKLRTDVNVFLPDRLPENAESSDLPVVYLLHGLSGSRDDWMLNTALPRYADEYKVIVVCPEGQRGFYLDLPNGPAWFTYITEELPSLLGQWLKIGQKREQTYIAGDSMGAYGATRIAAVRADQYKGLASFSGPLSIALFSVLAKEEPLLYAEMEKMLGTQPENIAGTDLDPEQWLASLAAESKTTIQDLCFFCGLEDPFLDMNRYFVKLAKLKGLQLKYEESPGGHAFRYWDGCLDRWLSRITKAYYKQFPAEDGGRNEPA